MDHHRSDQRTRQQPHAIIKAGVRLGLDRVIGTGFALKFGGNGQPNTGYPTRSHINISVRLEKRPIPSDHRGMRSVTRVQFSRQGLDVQLDRHFLKIKVNGDLFVGFSFANTFENLHFTLA